MLRFPKVFAHFNHTDSLLARQIESHYLSICPNKPHLIDGAIQLLEFLKMKPYPLHILTNGFLDTQHKKIAASNILHYFNFIVTSESSSFSKPDNRSYFHLLDQINHEPEECIMVGDNLISDIAGSSAIGTKNIYFNPEKLAIKVTKPLKFLI